MLRHPEHSLLISVPLKVSSSFLLKEFFLAAVASAFLDPALNHLRSSFATMSIVQSAI